MASSVVYRGPWFSYASPNEIWALATVLPAVCILIVGLRFYVRKLQKERPDIGDWLIVPALLFYIGMCICMLYGVGKHVMGYPSPPDNITAAGNTSWQQRLVTILGFSLQMMMALVYGCVKLSVLFFYRRLFVTSRGSVFDTITKVAIVIVITWTTTFFFADFLSCGAHPSAEWGNILSLEKYCPHSFQTGMAFLSSDFATDVLILVLPMPIIWKLHMQVVKKIAVTVILLLGSMMLAASITRVAIYAEIKQRGFDPAEDVIKTESTSLYWSTMEAGLTIIAACLPTLQALFTQPSVNSMVRSVRSKISLRSTRSALSQDQEHFDKQYSPYTEINRNTSMNSTLPSINGQLTGQEQTKTEAYAMVDLGTQQTRVQPGTIRVENTVFQSDHMV